jgi:hypothetical protein
LIYGSSEHEERWSTSKIKGGQSKQWSIAKSAIRDY